MAPGDEGRGRRDLGSQRGRAGGLSREKGPRKPEGQDWRSVQREGALSVKETVVEAGVLRANLKSPPGRHPNSQASLGLPQALTEASASVSSSAQTSDRRLCWHLSFS